MEDKPARLTVLMDAEKKKAFEALCASQDITASQVVRRLIRDYMEQQDPPAAAKRAAPRKPAPGGQG